MKKISKAAWILCCFFIFCIHFFYYPKWKQTGTEATISWDVTGYYLYLPSLFIYKDLKQLEFKDSIFQKYLPTPDFQQAFKHYSGNYVFKYSAGQAIFYSPFFFIGHFIAGNSNTYPNDGFSFPYQVTIGLGMLLYAFLGLYYLRRLLLEFFPDGIVALTLFVLVFGTNYLNYAAIDGAMTHNPLFTVYCLLLYFCHSFYKSPDTGKAILIGCLVGLATLTRPTEIISAFLPICWGVHTRQSLKERIQFILNYRTKYIKAAISTLCIMSVQIVYWKFVAGEWLVYSYQQEKFSFLSPHFKECFIGFRAGWLIYSPAMILGIAGFLTLYNHKKSLFWPLAIFCFLFTWICFSWDVWWYGGSLGQRAMIQSYPIWAFPMASLLYWLFLKNSLVKALTSTFLTFCIWFNLWITHQGHWGGLLRVGEMTRPYFWAIFGRSEVNERVEHLLDNKTIYLKTPENPILVFSNNFEKKSSLNNLDSTIVDDRIMLDSNLQFSTEYFFTVPGNIQWIRASADFSINEKEWNVWEMTQFVMRFYRMGKIIQTNYIRIQRIMKDGETKSIFLDVKMPSKEFDKTSVLFWNSGSDKKIAIDNLKVICF